MWGAAQRLSHTTRPAQTRAGTHARRHAHEHLDVSIRPRHHLALPRCRSAEYWCGGALSRQASRRRQRCTAPQEQLLQGSRSRLPGFPRGPRCMWPWPAQLTYYCQALLGQLLDSLVPQQELCRRLHRCPRAGVCLRGQMSQPRSYPRGSAAVPSRIGPRSAGRADSRSPQSRGRAKPLPKRCETENTRYGPTSRTISAHPRARVTLAFIVGSKTRVGAGGPRAPESIGRRHRQERFSRARSRDRPQTLALHASVIQHHNEEFLVRTLACTRVDI